jgi:chromate transporter
MRPSVLLTLAAVFVPLSFATIGGGQGIVAEVHRQSVSVQGWMSQEQFVTDFALSRLAPGPGSLLITLIGWQVAGWAGAVVASFAIFLPSSLLLYGLARLWARYHGRAWQRAFERGMAPVAAGLILAGAWTVLQASEGGWLAWAVAAASAAVLMATRVSPFIVLAAGALVFLLTT